MGHGRRAPLEANHHDRRMRAAALGKMPFTRVRHLISALTRSRGLVNQV
jgi:hypothetical protein